MDEAFVPFSKMLEEMIAIEGELNTPEGEIRTYIYEAEIDTPIELEVFTGDDGSLHIGAVPPLYRVNTTFKPSFHQVEIKVKITDSTDE